MEDLKEPKRKRNAQPWKKSKLISKDEEAIPDIEDIFSDKETQKIRESLLDWYDHHQRDLPWRRKQTNPLQVEEEEEKEKRAYGVWVSEVMLQQTRVQTVIDYYNRWMLKWPTLQHLALSSLEEVNEMWAGLGYYRRARFLLEVPGIGDYTAGAIASIAFKEVVPVVDGNVIRVLARLKAISANPKDSMTIKNFWKLATQLVDPCCPGDFNQSLMELGATVCTPSNPSCTLCPISSQCRALSISKQDKSVLVTDYPTKVVKVKQRREISAVCVVEILGTKGPIEGDQSDSGFLLVKRPDNGLLAGLWEFPTVNMSQEADLTTRKKEIDHFLKKVFRLDPQKTCSMVLREHIGEFVHIFSHIRLKVYVELLVIHLKGGMSEFFSKHKNEGPSWKYVEKKDLSNLGLTSGVRKVYTMVEKFKQSKLSTDSAPAKKKRTNMRKLRSTGVN
ncbi:adenine DNA glycosylase isoform X2 [Hevea brasiliensis]|uniref:adenine DNA glycosylase isoform X2 n=1 Tax=Hevea brasiliensis TaxID=3981 RepID=UPI0025D4CAC8|nr:adenine DNA glycosylase isoform X2 [Hevea brasiliensis]